MSFFLPLARFARSRTCFIVLKMHFDHRELGSIYNHAKKMSKIVSWYHKVSKFSSARSLWSLAHKQININACFERV